MSTTGSTDSDIQFTVAEALFARQTLQVVAQSQRGSTTGMSDRGRGVSRTSASNSRAASAASSTGGAKIPMDAGDLSRLDASLTFMVGQMTTRFQQLERQLQSSIEQSTSRANLAREDAIAQMKLTKKLMADMAAMEEEIDVAKSTMTKIKKLRIKAETQSQRIDYIQERMRTVKIVNDRRR